MTVPELSTPRSGYGGRGYRIPGRLNDEGKQLVYPSVTTILKSVAKPELMQWVADQTAAYAVAHIDELMQNSEEIGWGFLRFFWGRTPDLTEDQLKDDPSQPGYKMRLHHAGVRDDAAELGTNIHEWIEAEIEGLGLHPELDTYEADEMSEAFRLWLSGHEVTSHASEFTVVDDDRQVAGTADADWSILCLHGGEPCLPDSDLTPVRVLVDLKSSRNTWDENGFQVAQLMRSPIRMVRVPEGYEGAAKFERTTKGRKVRTWWVEESQEGLFEAAALLHIRPSDLTADGDKIPAFCRLIDLTPDLDLYQDGFDAATLQSRTTYRLKQRKAARAKENTEV